MTRFVGTDDHIIGLYHLVKRVERLAAPAQSNLESAVARPKHRGTLAALTTMIRLSRLLAGQETGRSVVSRYRESSTSIRSASTVSPTYEIDDPSGETDTRDSGPRRGQALVFASPVVRLTNHNLLL